MSDRARIAAVLVAAVLRERSDVDPSALEAAVDRMLSRLTVSDLAFLAGLSDEQILLEVRLAMDVMLGGGIDRPS